MREFKGIRIRLTIGYAIECNCLNLTHMLHRYPIEVALVMDFIPLKHLKVELFSGVTRHFLAALFCVCVCVFFFFWGGGGGGWGHE